jgi:two-component system, OmpR family, sensor histidine kinase ArlS
MPIRIKITLLFTATVLLILFLVCASVYYFSYTSRTETIRTRLTNRAITTGRLLSQSEVFDKELVRKIDSFTTIALKNKVVQAYNHENRLIYMYSDVWGDNVEVDNNILNDARVTGSFYFTAGDKDAVAYHYTDRNARFVLITAGEDIDGLNTLRRLLQILMFSFIAGVITTAIAGYLFSARLLAPVRKIADDVSEISARNLTKRIRTTNAKDEWHYLTTTMNELLDRLQDSFESQKRFVANASHELSTPLTSISSQLEIGLQRIREPEEYQKILQSVHQDVRFMIRLTQTLLEFAKASGSPDGIELGKVRMDEVILLMPAELQKTKRDYKVVIDFASLPEEEEGLVVYGNAALLFLAIRNVVINACKYSANRQANVRLFKEDNMIMISVCDTGKGIPEKDITAIFLPFYRATRESEEKGFGLGLSLTDRIIRLHNGSIRVASTEGMGSCFYISLPVSAEVS